MRRILASAVVLIAGASAFADVDLSAIVNRANAQAAVTTGKVRAAYVALEKKLAKAERPGLGDDFVKLRATASAVAGRLAADAELALEMTDALDAGRSALAAESTSLVQLTAALESDRDRTRCGTAGAKGRILADRAATARAQGRSAACADLCRRAAAAYEGGTALATKLLARQDQRRPAWSLPLHDLGGALLSVWAGPGPAPDVYAVGSDDGTGPLFLRKGGEGWVRVPIAPQGTLWWVTGIGSRIFTSGTLGRVARYDPADGSVTDMSVGFETTLYGVWGTSETNVWAVGGNVDGAQPRSSLMHHDGTSWTSVPLPPEANNRTLFKVTGTAEDDVWVCGQAGLLMHWDGVMWTVHGSGTFESLFTIHGTSPVISVGGSVQPTIVELGTQGWSPRTVPTGSETLRGVFVPPQGDAWACGLNGTVLRRVEGRWQRIGGLPQATGNDFHAVTLDDAGGVYLAGGSLTLLDRGSLFYYGPRAIPSLVLPQAKLRDRIQPVLYPSCSVTACHIGPFVSADLDLSTPELTLAQSVGVPSRQSPLLRVLPGRPSQSYLWHKMLGTQKTVGGSGDRMPQGGALLSQADMDAIRAWILEGALDD